MNVRMQSRVRDASVLDFVLRERWLCRNSCQGAEYNLYDEGLVSLSPRIYGCLAARVCILGVLKSYCLSKS